MTILCMMVCMKRWCWTSICSPKLLCFPATESYHWSTSSPSPVHHFSSWIFIINVLYPFISYIYNLPLLIYKLHFAITTRMNLLICIYSSTWIRRYANVHTYWIELHSKFTYISSCQLEDIIYLLLRIVNLS